MLRDNVENVALPTGQRVAALEKLSDLRPAWLLDVVFQVVGDPALVDAALKIAPSFDDDRVSGAIVAVYPSLTSKSERAAAINALSARPRFARTLLEAVSSGQVSRADISVAAIRQIGQLGDVQLKTQSERMFGVPIRSLEETRKALTQYRAMLPAAVLADASLVKGAELFAGRCGACHALFGRGGKLAPDLTGSGRKDLDYLLLKILDPSGSMSEDYRLNSITLSDGQVVLGSIAAQSPRALTVRTLSGEQVIERAAIRELKPLTTSLMPAGLMDGLTRTELRDLFGYLMSDGPALEGQVSPLIAEGDSTK